VKDLGKRYIAYGAVRFVVRHPDVMRSLSDAGLDALIMGLEFVSDAPLASYRKGSSAADNDEALRVCRELGIEVFALFMVDPDWSHAEARSLARYLLSRDLPFATFSTLQVFPGTALARTTGAQLAPLWRYDLLRLHQRPRHLSRASYYLWLFLLYMLPSLRLSSLRTLWRRYGARGCLGLVARSAFIGLDYFVRLVRWS